MFSSVGCGRAEPVRGGAHRGVQLLARTQRLALRARPGADAPLPVARLEILVALGGRRLDHHALDADLAMRVIPVEHQRGARVLRELAALARVVVRHERHAAVLDVELLAQHHARRGLPGRGRGGEHHGVGVWLLAGGERGGEPGAGERHRLGGQGIGQQVVVELHGRYVIRDAASLAVVLRSR